jgi:hypothetical protein
LAINLTASPSGWMPSTSTGSGKSGPVMIEPTRISSMVMVVCA